MLLRVENNLIQYGVTPQTYTSTNLAAGGTAVSVKNINALTNQYAVQFGNTGEELAEVQLISGVPSGITFNTSGTIKYPHPVDTPIHQIHYDKIIFKRSTAGTAGTASAITNGTISITPDSQYTLFDDTSGAISYAYKTQYYNSLNGDLSAESDWFVPGGPSFYSLQKIRERVKNKLISSNYIKSDDVIDEWINEYLEELNTAAIKVNKDYLLGTTSLTFGTAGLGTITDTDFMYARKIEVNYSGTTYLVSSFIPVHTYSDADTFSVNDPYHSWVGDTVLKILPAGTGGTIRLTYAKGESLLADDTDELPHPMRRYTRGFTAYALACAQELDDKESLANKNYAVAKSVKADFIAEITPRDLTGVHYIDFTENLSGAQDDAEYF